MIASCIIVTLLALPPALSGLNVKAIAAPVQSIEINSLPEYLIKIGETAFGSRAGLEEALLLVAAPVPLHAGRGKTMLLTSDSRDDTLVRLQGEMQKDRYGVTLVKATQGLIVDIGSNVGDLAIRAALAHPGMQVLAVEPSPHTFFYLALNLHLNNIPLLSEQDLGHYEKAGVFAINAAVTKDGRTVEMRWTDAASQNGAIETHEASTVSHNWLSAQVPSFQMEDFMKSHGIDSIEFLKIDCEGCEFEVIPSMKNLFLNRDKVKLVSGEIHQSLKDRARDTDAKKPATEEVTALDSILEERGCLLGVWNIRC